MKASVALGELPYAAVMPWPTTLLRFSRKPLLRPLESSDKFSSRILELEMHTAVLRFTFRHGGECAKVSRYFAPERG